MELKEQLQAKIDQLDKVGLWSYLETSRRMKTQATLIEELVKARCKLLMGDQDSLALDGDAGVYTQYSPRYEVSLLAAEELIHDQDMLHEIVKVDMTKAKEILPEPVFLELQTKRVLKGEPTRKLMVGKLKL